MRINSFEKLKEKFLEHLYRTPSASVFYNYSLVCKIMDENFHFLSLGLLIHL